MTAKKIIALMFLVLVGFVFPVSAAIEDVTLRVDGLACPFCAYGLEKKIKKLEGYKSFEVFINEGKVIVGWREDKPLDLESINEAVDKAGFTLRGVKGSFLGRLVKEDEKIFLLLDGQVKQRFYIYEPSEIKQKAERAHKLEAGPQAFSEATRKRLEKLVAGRRVVRIVGPVHAHRQPNRPMALGIEEMSVKMSFVGALTKDKGRFFLVVSQPITRRFSLYEPRKLKLISKDAHKLEGTGSAFSEATWKHLEELLAKKKTVKVIGEVHVHREKKLPVALGIEELKVVVPDESMKSSGLGSIAKSKKMQNKKEQK
jgi:mercuric ion binding protein